MAMLRVCLVFLALFCFAPRARALTIKLGSLAPIGSPWDIGLKKLSAEWNRISGGEIVMKIYPGGIVGDEDDMIRKMRIGQLDAAAITGVGMNRIYNGILAIQLPLFIRNDRELEYVLEKMKPYFEEKLAGKGFKVLIWHTAGWAHFFGKKPIVHPDDLKKQKMWVWDGDPNQLQAWKEQGFQPVPLAATEIMTSLQSGMAEAFTTSPLTAAAYQWFGLAPNMCGMKWAPFLGSIIISNRVWDRIPEKLRPKLMETVRAIGVTLQKEALLADEKAVAIMQNNGLKVNPVPEQMVDQWKLAVDEGFKKIIGKSFEKAAYDKAKAHLEEFRRKNGK